MASPLLFGLGAIGAALAGRMILRQRAAATAEQWIKGGFQQKMDRKEALQILGLKFVIHYFRCCSLSHDPGSQRWTFCTNQAERCTSQNHDSKPP